MKNQLPYACMRCLARIFNGIMQRLGFIKLPSPVDIPSRLDTETLEKVMQEARFLYSQHGVDVRTLAPGEIPDLPKPVEDVPPTVA